MAAVAPSGAKEALSYPDSPPTTPSRPSPSVGRSPRSQAFVMTGDKILSLDHHISPSYAKVVRDQLPPRTQIQETPRRPPLTDFPSVRRSLRSRLPISISQPEVVTSKKEAEPSIERVTQTVVDPIDESTPSIATISSTEPQQAVISNEKTEKETDVCPLTASTSLVNSPTEVQKNAVMDSSMHSSYYKTAFSNPQLDHRTASNETFVISAADSSAKMSTVTVNPTTYIGTSVSAANSPSLRRVLGTKNTSQTVDSFGSFRSEFMSESVSSEEREASILASKFYRLEGLTKAEIADRLNDSGDFACLVANKYLELFTFTGLRIDAAIREFLSRVELIGESSQRERLLRYFSTRYHVANPSLFNNVDEVHTLTCALLLLNSDLHGPHTGKKMSCRDFVNNIGHMDTDLKVDLLKTLYHSIKDKAIGHDADVKHSISKDGLKAISSGTMYMEVDPDSQVEYKAGWLAKKTLYDSDGCKTPMGRRSWKIMYARLKGLVIYLDRDDGKNNKPRNRFETFSNAILLYHAFASPAPDYTKKKNTFRLRTAELGEILFHTDSEKDMNEWCSMINFVCAAFSSRGLPPPLASNASFVRTRLPRMPSQAPLSQQLKDHLSAAHEMKLQLETVQKNAPPLKAKGRQVEEFFFKERYLTQEVNRYEEYICILRERLRTCGTGSDSTSGIHSKSDMVDDMDKISYREAMQR